MPSKKDRRIPTPEEVPSIFDDKCIQELVGTARLPGTANIARFGVLVRDAALEYIRDANIASDNEVHHEVDGLLRAADRAVNARKRKDAACENVAIRIERLSERTRKLLNERGMLPDPEMLRDPATQHVACETIARLCRTGACWQEGRRRPGGKRSVTLVSVLHAPILQQNPARREAQLNFVVSLRLAYLHAAGKSPPRTANPERPGPFAKMARICLDKLRSGANAVEMLKELQRRQKEVEILIEQQRRRKEK
jgi:hypothetical protein